MVLGIVAVIYGCSSGSSAESHQERLRFNVERTFKIVQFTDTQDTQNTDPRTIALIGAVLEDQKPDLVVFTGDNIRGGDDGPKTPFDVVKAIDNIVSPVDDRNIPWLITFGNHDEESSVYTGLNADDQLKIYMSYPRNLNKPSPKGVSGTGNMNALVYSSEGQSSVPVFNIWALDSGRYAPEKIAGQTFDEEFLLGWTEMPDWDWIKPSQISWYTLTSEFLEKAFGKEIPSLMFFHIPLQEFRTMYENDEFKRQHPVLNLAPQHGVVGERNEDESPGPLNSGLFSVLLDRGDVKGVFVGHDHNNDYVGNYFGIYLGYSANAGFGTYGLGGADNNRLRGARVFVLNEDDPEHFETHMVFARDYGIQ